MSRPTARLSSLPTPGLTPMAPTRRFGHLPFPLGFALGRCRRRGGRSREKLLTGLRSPNDLHQLVPIRCLQGAAPQPLQECLAVFGAEGDLLESF